jgi:hypothetical protein
MAVNKLALSFSAAINFGRTDRRTDEWLTDGRTDGRMAFKKLFQPFFSHIRVLSQRIKRGYGPKNVFQPFLVISAFYPKG